MSEPVYPNDDADSSEFSEQPQLKTEEPDRTFRKGISTQKASLLGLICGGGLPALVIGLKIILCHYGPGQFGDVDNAFGMCVVPPAIAGAGITAGITALGRKIDLRAKDKEDGDRRAGRGERIGLWVGLVISFLVGVAPGLFVFLPDC